MIVLDTTILVYAVGAEHPLRAPCRAVLESVRDDLVQAGTTVDVIQEFAHVRSRRRSRPEAAALGGNTPGHSRRSSGPTRRTSSSGSACSRPRANWARSMPSWRQPRCGAGGRWHLPTGPSVMSAASSTSILRQRRSWTTFSLPRTDGESPLLPGKGRRGLRPLRVAEAGATAEDLRTAAPWRCGSGPSRRSSRWSPCRPGGTGSWRW